MSTLIEQLELALAPAISEVGAELVDIEVQSHHVQVIVERSGGLDLEALAQVSRAVSQLLDDREDLAPSGRYELEVSTPGLERRLRRPAHFSAAIGQRIALRTEPGTPGARRIEGSLLEADDLGIALAEGPGAEPIQLAYGQIERAHTVFDWQDALSQAKREREASTPGARRDSKVGADKRERRS